MTYVKARIDDMWDNSTCKLCDDRDKKVKHIIECSKLAQKNTGIGMIWCTTRKRLKFDCSEKWDA